MATTPKNVTMNTSAQNADYLNAIRSTASEAYQNAVPLAEYGVASSREIGQIVMNSSSLLNEFYSAMVNQFAFIFGSSKMFYNKWRDFKKGLIGLGELVEEFFVQIALPNNYNPEIAATQIFQRVIADVKTAIYRINIKTFYKTTINRPMIEMAFTTEGGMADLIGKVFTSMAAGCEVDQMNAIKYLLARKILDGQIKTVPISQVSGTDTEANAKAAAMQMKEDFDNFMFPRDDYNSAGVVNWCSGPNDVTFMLTTSFGAKYDISVLAAAFNLEYANFMGQVKKVDSLSNIDFDRLQAFFDDHETVTEFTEDEIETLDAVAAITFDNGLIQWYDRLYEWHEEPNGQAMEWQNWLHYWALLASSPFANAVAYIQTSGTTTGTVTSVTVRPSAVTLPAGASIPLTATVAGTGVFSKNCKWTATGRPGGEWSLQQNGDTCIVTNIGLGTSAITVTATSITDSSKKDTCTVTGSNVTS